VALGDMLMVPYGIFSVVIWVLDLKLWFLCNETYQVFSKSPPEICLLYFSTTMEVETMDLFQ